MIINVDSENILVQPLQLFILKCFWFLILFLFKVFPFIILQVVFRQGSLPPPLHDICCFSMLGTLNDDLVPPMALLLKAMPNLIRLRISNAVIPFNSSTNVSKVVLQLCLW